MTKFSAFLGMALMTLLLVCCGDDAIYQGDSGKGKVSLLLDINTSIAASRAETTMPNAPTIHDLTIKITPEDGSHAPYVYGYDEFLKADPNYPIGEYLLEVYCGDADAEGFDAAHYYGSAIFEIKADKTTEVAITASMSKSMFTIMYTDALKNYLRSYSATLQSQGGAPLAYLGNETRPIYVKSGVVSIMVNIEKQTGAASQIKLDDVNAEKAHHYKITIDLNANDDVSAGEGALIVEFDEMLQKEDVVVDLRDNLMNAAPPTVTPVGFEEGVAIEHLIGEKVTDTYSFSLTALGGFREVNMSTTQASAIGENWPASINLLGNLSDSQKSSLEAMGLKVSGLWTEITGEMATVDLTGVVEKMVMPATGNEVKITLSVIDQLGKTNGNPVTMTVELTQPKIVLGQVTNTLVYGEGQAEFDLEYNGPSAESLVYTVNGKEKTPQLTKTDAGKWHGVIDVPFVGDATVAVHNAVEATNPAYVEQKLAYTREDADYTSSWTDVENPGDVWATKVTLPCPAGISAPVFLIGSNGKSFGMYPTSLVDGKYPITGFTPATENYVLVCDDADHSKAGICYKFTTEAAPQLPNNGMEDWYTVAGKTQYWWIEYPGTDTNTPWGTMNLLTTSEGGNTAFNGFNYSKIDNTASNAFSGTRKTTESRQGNAAVIETIGWGRGNTQAGDASIVNNVTAGELYLGNYDTSSKNPHYNYPFTSRPASLTFFYKYKAKNSADYGYAEITVLDENGAVIATNNINITDTNSYTECTLELNYSLNSGKAANLHVIFKSSANPDCIKKDKANMTHPGTNKKDERNVGSALYIDDIKLNY